MMLLFLNNFKHFDVFISLTDGDKIRRRREVCHIDARLLADDFAVLYDSSIGIE